MKAAILYDSSAYLQAPLIDRSNLFQVDFTVALPNKEIIVESTDKEHVADFFNQWLQEDMPPPKTAQPSIQSYHTSFQKIIDAGYDTVFGVFLSSSLSGTFQTAEAIKREYEDKLEIINFNALGLSVNTEQLIEQLVFMIDDGWAFTEIKETITWLITNSRFFIALENNDNFIKGGRGDALTRLENSPIKTRPVLEYVHGDTPVLKEVFRTNKQRNNYFAQLAITYRDQYPGYNIKIGIGYTNSKNKAVRLKEVIQELLPYQSIDIRIIGTAFCSHLGRDALAFGLMPVAKGGERID